MRRFPLLFAALGALVPATLGAEPMPTAPPQPAASQKPSTNLAYVMIFVSDMQRSVAFYRDQVGLKLRFASPGWSEFQAGGTILALHPAGPNNKPGTSEVGLTVQDLDAFYSARKAAGVRFSGPPKPQSYGEPLTVMFDPDGAAVSVGGSEGGAPPR